ncbi:MAG: DNA-binding protein, partial [Candidatus Omnitrophica bacterium CG12_big_fil_rev_8_21_14_0_65_45_16]
MKDKKISRPFIEQKIFLIQGQKVMIDRDLANLYGVSTKALLQAVRRNKKRFPTDFAYQLTEQEFNNLRSQFVTSSWGGRRYLPYAFTEQGIAMLSSVLRSERAVLVNIAIMRAFVKLREAMVAHKELASQLKVLERKVGEHDEEIQAIFKAIRQLMVPPPEKPKRQ